MEAMNIHEALEAIKGRCEKATPGPVAWQKFGNEYYLTGQYGMRPIILGSRHKKGITVLDKQGLLVQLTPDHPDAIFYANARTDLPRVVQALELAVSTLESEANNSLSDNTAYICRQAINQIAALLAGKTGKDQ